MLYCFPQAKSKPSHVDTSMPTSEGNVIINRPLNEVFQYVINGENIPRWKTSFVEAHRDANTPIGLGMIIHQTMTGPGGRKFPGDYQVTEYTENRSFGFNVIAGPARPTGKYEFESWNGSSTKVTFSLNWEPKGWMQKLFMAPMVTKQLPKEVAELENLKKVLESKERLPN